MIYIYKHIYIHVNVSLKQLLKMGFLTKGEKKELFRRQESNNSYIRLWPVAQPHRAIFPIWTTFSSFLFLQCSEIIIKLNYNPTSSFTNQNVIFVLKGDMHTVG